MEVLQVPLQPLEPIRRRDHQVLQAARGVEGLKLALRWARKPLKLTHELILEQGLGPLVPERPDHEGVLYRIPVCGQVRDNSGTGSKSLLLSDDWAPTSSANQHRRPG